MFKKFVPLWLEAHFEVNMLKETACFAPLLDVEASFVWQALGCTLGILHPAKSEQYVKFFVAVSKTLVGVGHLKRTAKIHFAWQAQYKRHVYQMLGDQGADFLRIGASDLQVC